MTNLKCSVENCIHNSHHLCEMNTIAVKGRSAEESEATCCSTFRDDDGYTAYNSSKEVEPETNIECSAEACVYNNDCKCVAEHVDINGRGASKSEYTECSTFRIS